MIQTYIQVIALLEIRDDRACLGSEVRTCLELKWTAGPPIVQSNTQGLRLMRY